MLIEFGEKEGKQPVLTKVWENQHSYLLLETRLVSIIRLISIIFENTPIYLNVQCLCLSILNPSTVCVGNYPPEIKASF